MREGDRLGPRDGAPASSRGALGGLLVLGLWAVFRWRFFEGFWGYDDLDYVHAALQDTPPRNVFGARILYVGLLRWSLSTFGYGEVQAALPALVASLLVTALAFGWAWRRWGPLAGTVAGAVMATLPLDVALSTTPWAHPVANAFAAGGTALLLGAQTNRWSWRYPLAGGLCGLAMTTHLSFLLFVIGCALATSVWSRGRSRWLVPAAVVGVAAAVFWLTDSVLMTMAGSEASRFELIEKTFYGEAGPPTDGVDPAAADSWWWLRRLFYLLASKELGLVLSIGLLAGLTVRRTAPLAGRCGLVLFFGWLCLSFGTQDPRFYLPLNDQLRFWYPLAPPAAWAIGALATESGRQLRVLLLVLTVGLSPLLLALSGPWGQGVEVSRELLEFAREHPQREFFVDPYSYDEMYYLLGSGVPTNVAVCGARGPAYAPGDPLVSADCSSRYLLINVLQDHRWKARPAIEARGHATVERISCPEPRLLVRGLPLFAPRSEWWVRRPAALYGSWPGQQPLATPPDCLQAR